MHRRLICLTLASVQALEAEATQFDTYEDYLDSQIQKIDLYYLEDEDMARQLVELGNSPAQHVS